MVFSFIFDVCLLKHVENERKEILEEAGKKKD